MNFRTVLLSSFLLFALVPGLNAQEENQEENQESKQEYKVEKINESGMRAVVESPGTLRVGEELVFEDEFSEKCLGKIISSNSNTAVVDMSLCSNRDAIKVGSVFKTTSITHSMPAQQFEENEVVETKAARSGPTINEDWYTLWGLGLTSVTYGSAELNNAFNRAEESPDVTRISLNLDLFGFYWPDAEHKSLHGFVVNAVSDRVSYDTEFVSVNNYLYAYSFHTFFGNNIGDGWFLRGDVGVSRYLVEINVVGLSPLTETSDLGVGILAGGGYAFAIGQETRMLLGLYFSTRSAESERVTYANFNAGFLF